MFISRLFFCLRQPVAFAVAVLISTTLLAAEPGVTVTQNANSFTLSNGLVTARVSKRSGDLISLRYQHHQLLKYGSGHPYGYWSHETLNGKRFSRITINPKSNGGERGAVAVESIYNPSLFGGSLRRFHHVLGCNIDLRYAMQRGLPGVYAYAIFTHNTNDPATGFGESRFAAKLNPHLFNYLNVDAKRRKIMPTPADWLAGTVLNMPEARRLNTGRYKGQVEHKYDHSANQFDTRVYGWLGTKSHIGIWFINPSVEYLSGGPTKFELTGHLDISDEAAPTLLNYWRSSHYGGSTCFITNGEKWSKVVGPFLIYCNTGKTPDAMWQNAKAQAAKQEAAWPYNWVDSAHYPHKAQRGTVTGRLIVHDSQAPHLVISNLLVGLTAPTYTLPPFHPRHRRWGRGHINRFHHPNKPRVVTWQTDAKHYEFWVRGNANGQFRIPNVDPGHYTLHAIADGVLGDFTLTNINVTAGKTRKLGALDWRPLRYGKQLWAIGIPNRSGSEFFKGNDYYHWGWYLKYAKLFPHDVHYVIGKSNFHKDWFFEQVPHNENPNNTNGRGWGRSTTWTITFNLPKAPRGKAILRLAICGSSTRTITVTVNGQTAGVVHAPPYNATINRDGIEGTWSERHLVFDASLMKAGKNVMGLTIPAGSLTSGIIYDYIRLAMDNRTAAKK